MGFPADETDLEVGAAFGANIATAPAGLTYSTITGDVKPRVAISRGRTDRSAATRSTTIDLRLRNEDGVYSPRNIAGPRYGLLRHQTPVRVRLDPGSGMVTRATAYVPEWPPEWTGPDIDDRIPIRAGGMMQRLSIGQESKSALLRSTLAAEPIAYWPMDDGFEASQAVNAIVGGPPLTGSMPPNVDAPWPGSPSGLDISDTGATQLTAAIAVVSATSWSLSLAVNFFDNPVNNIVVLRAGTLRIDTYVFGASIGADFVDIATGTIVAQVFSSPALGAHHVVFTATQNGANIDVSMRLDGVSTSTDSIASTTLATPNLVTVNAGPVEAGPAGTTHIGGVAIFAPSAIPNLSSAVAGYAGEMAGARVARLCDEEGLLHDVAAGDSELMGVQAPGDVLTLLRECEDSDEGVLIERRTGEIGFDPRVSRYNRAPAMTLSYGTVAVAGMAVDDSVRDAVNRATVTRTGGSSATHERTAGARGTSPVTGIGVYPADASRSLFTDALALQHASWLVAIGTVDEPRYVITIDLWHPQNRSLVTQWLACDIGSRILVTNPPATRTGPDDLDLVLEGYDEVLDAVSWLLVLYLEPYRPYGVWEVETGSDNRSRIPAGLSYLNDAATSGATGLVVHSPNVPWINSTDYAAMFPFDIAVAGERMTVTAIEPLAKDAFGRTVANGWGTGDLGGAWSVNGGAASEYSVSGGTGQHAPVAVASTRITHQPLGIVDSRTVTDVRAPALATGAEIRMGRVLRYTNASNFYHILVCWQTDGTVDLTVNKRVAGTDTEMARVEAIGTYAAGDWWRLVVDIYGATIKASAWPTSNVQAHWMATVTDSSLTAAGSIGFRTFLNTGNTNALPLTCEYDLHNVVSPQTFTVVRSVNGVIKAQAAGAAVQLLNPPVLAL